MKRPRRLKFRPVRRPLKLDFNFDLGSKPSFSGFNHYFNRPPALLPPTAPPRPITAADLERLSLALRPAFEACRAVSLALRAGLLSPEWLRKLREAQDKASAEAKIRHLARFEELRALDRELRLEYLIRSAQVVRGPMPLMLTSY